MPRLAWVMLAVGITQPAAPTAPNAAGTTGQQPPSASRTIPLDEVIVTAPRRIEPAVPNYSVVMGEAAREFEAEATRKEEMRRYRATGAIKDYPGIRCAVFHHC